MASVGDDPDIKIIFHPARKKGLHRSILKFFEAILAGSMGRSVFYSSDFIDQLKKIKPQDEVLIFAVENLKELKIVSGFIAAKKIALFRWNPIRDFRSQGLGQRFFEAQYIKSLKKLFSPVATFDPDDAARYGLMFVEQVYAFAKLPIPSCNEPKVNLYFVGQDKGRLSQLKLVASEAERLGLSRRFHIVRDKEQKYTKEELVLLSDRSLSYEDNLALISRADVLVEIVQDNQSGITVRSLEAAFFGKKLITNNKRIMQTKLYDPSRVFIFEHENLQELQNFLETPLREIDPSILKDYEFKHWCRNFFRPD
jgi:hypothetical protein